MSSDNFNTVDHLRVSPVITPIIDKLLNQPSLLFAANRLHKGPAHLLFPQVMDDNCQKFSASLDTIGLPHRVYYAAKANNSQSLLRHVLLTNGFVDVSSEAELIRALGVGFVGSQIECTGPKNRSFLTLGLRHQCLISIDSIEELEVILSLGTALSLNKPTPILARISDPTTSDRNLQARPSKFGIRSSELNRLFELIGDESKISLKGFHFHKDGYDSEARAGFVSHLLNMMEQAYERGLEPDIINVGGGWRTKSVNDVNEWSRFIDRLEHQVVNQQVTDVWGRDPYGLSLNNKGRISGRERALQKVYTSHYDNDIRELFTNASLRGQSLAQLIRESMFTVIFEPGYALLQNVGITLIKVVGSKFSSDGRPLVRVEANPYNLSVAKMFELVCDPILIPRQHDQQPNGWSGFITGNLCLEDDLLMRRRVHLSHKPQEGDLLCFINTAPYFGNFEDASPILQPQGHTFVATEGESGFELYTDESYYP